MNEAAMFSSEWVGAISVALLSLFRCCNSHGDHEEYTPHSPSNSPTLIISFDGFRYDYVERLRNLTSGTNSKNYFQDVISSGVWAKAGLQNVFSTVTFPNHYSIVTGLYQETHGVVGNSVFLPEKKKTFHLTNVTREEAAEIYGGEPIWVTFAKQKSKFRVGCFMWVGCDVAIKNLTLPSVVPFGNSSCDQRVDFTVRWLAGGMDLVLLYFPEPDASGHKYGPDSKEVNDILLGLNDCLGKLVKSMQHRNLFDSVNMLLVSDHGMIKFRKTVIVPEDPQLFKIRVEHYSHFLIEPLPGKEGATKQHLKSQFGNYVKVYSKSEIPEHWHYRNSPRITEILIVAEVGVRLSSAELSSSDKMVAGHGYDNSAAEMRPMFLARGPAFAENVLAPKEIHSVDLYLLMCRLLGISPAPNNGSDTVVDHLIKTEEGMPYFGMVTASILITVISSTCAVVFVLVFVFLYRVSSKKGRQFASIRSVGMTEDGYRPVKSALLAGNESESEEDFQSS